MTTTPSPAAGHRASCTECAAAETFPTYAAAVDWTFAHADDCPDCATEIAPAEAAAGPSPAPAAPADATRLGDWVDYDDTGEWSRDFTGSRHEDGIVIIGLQHADGTVERVTGVHLDDTLTPTAARTFAARLVAAANEADMLDAIERHSAGQARAAGEVAQ